uniref:Uncharacterized protein n=1 Tax=Emiliania huxleyi (strain CCMP1516) TaxID=280463 RepID=A0A0D3J2D6_EMIH1
MKPRRVWRRAWREGGARGAAGAGGGGGGTPALGRRARPPPRVGGRLPARPAQGRSRRSLAARGRVRLRRALQRRTLAAAAAVLGGGRAQPAHPRAADRRSCARPAAHAPLARPDGLRVRRGRRRVGRRQGGAAARPRLRRRHRSRHARRGRGDDPRADLHGARLPPRGLLRHLDGDGALHVFGHRLSIHHLRHDRPRVRSLLRLLRRRPRRHRWHQGRALAAAAHGPPLLHRLLPRLYPVWLRAAHGGDRLDDADGDRTRRLPAGLRPDGQGGAVRLAWRARRRPRCLLLHPRLLHSARKNTSVASPSRRIERL